MSSLRRERLRAGKTLGGLRARVCQRLAGVLAVGLPLALCSLTACVEWTTDPQGNPQSIGLPGVPLWQTQTLAEQKRLAAQGDLAASPGAMIDPAATNLISTASDAPWLAHMNRWRTAAGLDPVGENVGLSLGSTPRQWAVGECQPVYR